MRPFSITPPHKQPQMVSRRLAAHADLLGYRGLSVFFFFFFFFFFCVQNAGMVMSDLEVDVRDELGNSSKFLLGSPQLAPEVSPR